VQLDGRKLAEIRRDKALRLAYYQDNSNRLTSPMRRRPDGSYEKIDWDTAISEVAVGFKRDTYAGAPRRKHVAACIEPVSEACATSV
jgi:formate dehydrogenase